MRTAALELVVKFGGSLQKRDHFPRICRDLDAACEGAGVLVTPGGGDFADTVRRCDSRLGLSPHAAHWMSVLAMDQMGLLLASIMPRGGAVRSLPEAETVCAAGGLPVLLPGEMLRETGDLPETWEVTSDTIACRIAREYGIPSLVLLKDALPPDSLSVKELSDRGWLDPCFPGQFEMFRGEGWIGNGVFPLEALNGEEKAALLRA